MMGTFIVAQFVRAKSQKPHKHAKHKTLVKRLYNYSLAMNICKGMRNPQEI